MNKELSKHPGAVDSRKRRKAIRDAKRKTKKGLLSTEERGNRIRRGQKLARKNGTYGTGNKKRKASKRTTARWTVNACPNCQCPLDVVREALELTERIRS